MQKYILTTGPALANDSVFEFEVLSADSEKIVFRSKSDGVLINGKGVHVRGIHKDIPFLFEKDRQLIGLAKQHGIQILAVTDHETIDGIDEAQRAGAALGLRVIRGVELSAPEHHSFHILGYGFRDGDTELAALCEKLRAGRDDRKYKIVNFLREKGVDVDLAEVEELAGGEVIGRPHFARTLVKHGYVSSNREAFDRYLDTEEFRQKVKRFKADSRTCVEAIKSAGGKVSLAHPYQMGLPEDELDALVKQLKDWGLVIASLQRSLVRDMAILLTCRPYSLLIHARISA